MSYDARLIEEGRCPELVEVVDEDGRHDGRCLAPTEGGYACAVHAAEMAGWMGLSEMEKAEWERRHDAENP